MEDQGLNEALALYRASVRQSPGLMMETVSVDSNRGVTARGNSPYDRYASPATRAKVLESRLQEIQAFAQSRGIPASNIYALAEAAMRTGKIPDLGQFGLAGDDAVATKQFLISNVLNIQGLEWTDYKGDPVEEAAPEPVVAPPAPLTGAQRFMAETAAEDEAGVRRQQKQAQSARSRAAGRTEKRRAEKGATAYQMDDVRIAAHRSVAEIAEQIMAADEAGQIRPAPEPASRFHDITDVAHQIMGEDSEKAKKVRDLRGRNTETLKSLRYSTDKTTGASPARQQARSVSRADASKRSWQSDTKGHKAFMDDVSFDPRQFMAESGQANGLVGGSTVAPLSPSRSSSGGDRLDSPMSYSKKDLLPKAIMAQLRKVAGDGIYGMPREELFRLARERGLLGTEE